MTDGAFKPGGTRHTHHGSNDTKAACFGIPRGRVSSVLYRGDGDILTQWRLAAMLSEAEQKWERFSSSGIWDSVQSHHGGMFLTPLASLICKADISAAALDKVEAMPTLDIPRAVDLLQMPEGTQRGQRSVFHLGRENMVYFDN